MEASKNNLAFKLASKTGGKLPLPMKKGTPSLRVMKTGDISKAHGPVVGWTTHHSIVEFDGKWYLFYHDASLSGGVDHKRCVKFTELHYEEDGRIRPVLL